MSPRSVEKVHHGLPAYEVEDKLAAAFDVELLPVENGIVRERENGSRAGGGSLRCPSRRARGRQNRLLSVEIAGKSD